MNGGKDSVEGVEGLKDTFGLGVFQRDTGREHLLRRADNNGLDLIVAAQALNSFGNLNHHGDGEYVVGRMVQNQPGNETGGIELYEFKAFCCFRFAICYGCHSPPLSFFVADYPMKAKEPQVGEHRRWGCKGWLGI